MMPINDGKTISVTGPVYDEIFNDQNRAQGLLRRRVTFSELLQAYHNTRDFDRVIAKITENRNKQEENQPAD